MKLFLLALVCTFCCATTIRADEQFDKIYIDANCIAITDNGICLSLDDEIVFGISQLNYDEHGYFVHDRDFYDDQQDRSKDRDRSFYTMNYTPQATKACEQCRKRKKQDTAKGILLACKSN